MYIGRIMHTDLVTVTPDNSLVQARRIMDSKPIEHLLVVDKQGELVGILSDRDLKQNWASPATTLSAHELSYLLEKVEVRSIMIRTVLTVSPSTTVERAAYILQQNSISALPVLDKGKLVGIITSSDVMGVLLHAIGMGKQSSRLSVYVKDDIGALSRITSTLRDEKINIQSIFSFPEYDYPGAHQIVFRVARYDEDRAAKALEKSDFKVVTAYVEDIRPYLPAE